MLDAALQTSEAVRAIPGAAQLSGQAPADAAREFEALIVGELAKLMMPDGSGPFGGGHAETIYTGMMAEHMGAAIAERGGLGLSGAVVDQLLRMGGAA